LADQQVVRAFRKAIRVRHASPREAKALFEAGITESNLRNLNYGDRDSKGPLQQRASTGWRHATQPYLAALDFLNQAQPLNRKGFRGSAGQLAQAVQRSAFPGRYDQHGSEAARFLAGVQTGSPSRGSTTTTTRTTGLTPDALQGRRALLAQFVMSNQRDPVALAQGIQALNQTQTTTKVRTTGGGTPSGPVAPSGAAGSFKTIFEKAAAINAKHLPYRWGGGHGPTPAKPGVPLDCSGAVSAVLGVSPRVAAQFKSYGNAGRGKHVTIWAARDGHHVLLEIDGHLWGTSGDNPGGGAGWIKRSYVGPQYLSGFIARHPPGM
jgi:hypothetical protein